MRNRRAVTEPVGALAHKAEARSRGVEVIPNRDAVQVIRRPVGVADRARNRVEQDRDRQLVGEGDADGGSGRAGRILFIDFLDSYEEVLRNGACSASSSMCSATAARSFSR